MTRTALDRHDTRVRLHRTLDVFPALRRQIEALELWNRWARGDTINVQQLGDTITELTGITRRTTPTSSEHSAKRHTMGRRRCHRPANRHDTPEPSSEPAPNSDCDERQTATRSVDPDEANGRGPRDPPQEGRRANGRARGSPQTHEIGVGGTKVPSIQPESGHQPGRP